MLTRLSPRFMTAACALAGVLLVAFWTTWFVDRDLLASEHRSEYFTFENAFPLADGWMALCSFLAAWALAARRPVAVLWLIAAGSASAFLAGMDVLYDLENGVYAKGGPAYVELAINVLTALYAATTMSWAWSRRDTLLAADGARDH